MALKDVKEKINNVICNVLGFKINESVQKTLDRLVREGLVQIEKNKVDVVSTLLKQAVDGTVNSCLDQVQRELSSTLKKNLPEEK